MSERIAVIGAGTWGTALARLLANKHEDVILWAYEPEVARSINQDHRNCFFLSEIDLPKNLKATNDIAEALAGRKIVVSVVPTQVLRKVWEKAAPALEKGTVVVSCSKGFEEGTQKLPSEILAECMPEQHADYRVALSGPSFAKEVARDLPTSVTIAGNNADIAKKIQNIFRTERFLPFTHSDVVGAEVGGAVKNVIAIATGISDGLGFGKNARAALITRGLYEMIKIGKARGADPYTFIGLAGIGDLLLTATDEMSRNYTVGKRMGHGEKIEDIIGGMKMVAEGYRTSVAVNDLLKKHGINAPVCATTYRILHRGMEPREGAAHLCSLKLAEELRALYLH